MNFTAVLGLDVLRMSAGKTDEGNTPTVSTNAAHTSYSLHDVFRYPRD
jgi:hypothetical protein